MTKRVTDWDDDGWNEFEAEFLGDELLDKATRLLLKQAWLHGARTAIDKAVDVTRSDEKPPPTRLVSTSRYEPPTYEKAWQDDPDESRDDE